MTTHVEHIAGHTYHARKGVVQNAFRYSVDYVLLDAETPKSTPEIIINSVYFLPCYTEIIQDPSW
ncbi:MAG: hypothetical protein ACPGVS_02840 [Primorskyibacter sp.]